MTYQETAALVGNFEYQQRVTAAAVEQALVFVNDARPEFSTPATAIILSAINAVPFINLVAGQPAITEDSTDVDILAALQAVWPMYGTALLASEADAV